MDTVKTKNFIVQSNVAHAYTKITDFEEREPIFVWKYTLYWN